jgi:uncharacterized Zn-binding protein involved in type VI secretion
MTRSPAFRTTDSGERRGTDDGSNRIVSLGSAVQRLGDLCTGHGCWPPRPNAEGSGTVLCNGLPVHREGDAWEPHTCPDIPETHASVLAQGSATVFVNGRGIGRAGDPVACGSVAVPGSPNVFAGG